MQLFVKKPETVTVDINPSDTTLCLKNKIEARTNIPAVAMRLLFAGKQLDDASTLESASIEGHATLHLVLSLRGGKGGFGAMLRTAGARGVKTTNFDACRDLNGRRLKHVNAERDLREWDEKAEERKLAKQQQQAANAKPSGPPPIARFDDDEYEEKMEGARNRVNDALAAGLAACSSVLEADNGAAGSGSGGNGTAQNEKADGVTASTHGPAAEAGGAAAASTSNASNKRKVVEEAPAPAPAAKAAKIGAAFDPLAGLCGDDDDDDDDEEEAAA